MLKTNKETQINEQIDSPQISNQILDLAYKSSDERGNIYQINSISGTVEDRNENILILEDVTAKIIIKNYMHDHRIFMTCVIAGLTFGGKWIIHDSDSVKTSFPSFLKILNNLQN